VLCAVIVEEPSRQTGRSRATDGVANCGLTGALIDENDVGLAVVRAVAGSVVACLW